MSNYTIASVNDRGGISVIAQCRHIDINEPDIQTIGDIDRDRLEEIALQLFRELKFVGAIEQGLKDEALDLTEAELEAIEKAA